MCTLSFHPLDKLNGNPCFVLFCDGKAAGSPDSRWQAFHNLQKCVSSCGDVLRQAKLGDKTLWLAVSATYVNAIGCCSVRKRYGQCTAYS